MAEEVLKLLCSTAKLDRDKGVRELEKILEAPEQTTLAWLASEIEIQLKNPQSAWESKHGGLMGAKCLLLSEKYEDENASFAQNALSSSLQLLEDSESRVRLAAGRSPDVFMGSELLIRCM